MNEREQSIILQSIIWVMLGNESGEQKRILNVQLVWPWDKHVIWSAFSTDNTAQDTEIFCPRSVVACLANLGESCKSWKLAKEYSSPEKSRCDWTYQGYATLLN